ncbi:putative sedoheptulokinase [Apostichopus japonicus]|uniref:Putative sedoheptulokinase n=1 Tax=Stichopus japonicus TaxID=307972 RepID=A0A2G8LK66_STIJA|nr:putative sedoheptulokinase [Apostichopus japonicus]
MSVQNAASWGYFNCQSGTWNTEILSSAGFPTRLLPKIQEPGSRAGSMPTAWFGLTTGTKVGVAMGDLPCSVYSVLDTPTDAVLNMGTSAQLVRSMPEGFIPDGRTDPSSVEYFVYFNKKYIAVAAALNGGNVLSTFVDMLLRWCSGLGSNGPSDRDQVFTKLIHLAGEVETDLVVDPVLLGERHRQSDRGSISNLKPGNTDLGGVFRAICRGIITNIESMMPKEELRRAGVERIVGCGSTLSQNMILKEELERCFQLPVVYRDEIDACVGAALFVQSTDWS